MGSKSKNESYEILRNPQRRSDTKVKKTKKGKIFLGSFGKVRPAKPAKSKAQPKVEDKEEKKAE